MKCYYFKEINNEKGFLDNIIDCTYIMLLENSPREKNVFRQLEEFVPSKKIIIQYNKGYKNCKKKLIKQTSNYDILDSYITIFKHANSNHYDKILVLEDDFIFSKKIVKHNIIKDIESLYKNYDVNLFNFGSPMTMYNPFFINYTRYNCNKLIFSFAAHSVIYSKKFRNKLIDYYDNNKINYQIDLHFNSSFIDNIYTYKIPLAFQTFPETENSKEWKIYNVNIFGAFQYVVSFFKINEKPEIGYNNLYLVLKIVNLIIYIIIVYTINRLFIQ